MFGFGKKMEGESSPTGAPDAELVHAARRGDKRAFVEIVARHQAMVCGIALGILGDFAASEDAAQEVFLTAWRRIHDLREPTHLRAWLAQIARNSALGFMRRRKGHDPIENASPVPDDSPTPDEAAANEEEAQLVRESLAKLPENYRLPLILFYRDGQSVRGVAEALGISEDAVKQRLARGRDMLRDQMAVVIESVLTRTRPTAVFTMTIAAAIGALAAPAAIAGTVFATASATTASAGTTWTATPFLTAMSTSKTFLVTVAVVGLACIPVGYHFSTGGQVVAPGQDTPQTLVSKPRVKGRPSFEGSALFAEWRKLHEIHGTAAEDMPEIYKAIADIKDPFRRRSFRAALISEWVQLDPAGGFRFFAGKGPDANQRKQFFEEWLAADPAAAVNTLLSGSPGWEAIAQSSLKEIARSVPSSLAQIVERLPKSENNYWDTKVRDAFEVMAEGSLPSAKAAAEGLKKGDREQALAGVAKAWAKTDLEGAIAWSRGLPEGTDRNEIIRAALLGRASVDPVAALDLANIVPPGGRDGYFATSTGARVLTEAAKADYDGTVAWIKANSGRLGHEDMLGLAKEVTERLNADPLAFLNRHAADDSLKAIMPALSSALLNDGSGQRAKIWDWLKTQPSNETTKALRDEVLRSAGYQDPMLAIRLATDLPSGPESETQLQTLARSLFNGGQMLGRFDKLVSTAPDRLKGPLIDAAFEMLHSNTLDDPHRWIGRLSQLPGAKQPKATEAIARAWADQSPEEAVEWVRSLPPGETRHGAVAGVVGNWALKEPHSAAEWVAAMSPGVERDRSARSLVYALTDKYPREALEWAVSIADQSERTAAATYAVQNLAKKDSAAALSWIQAAPLPPETKASLQQQLGK